MTSLGSVLGAGMSSGFDRSCARKGCNEAVTFPVKLDLGERLPTPAWLCAEHRHAAAQQGVLLDRVTGRRITTPPPSMHVALVDEPPPLPPEEAPAAPAPDVELETASPTTPTEVHPMSDPQLTTPVVAGNGIDDVLGWFRDNPWTTAVQMENATGRARAYTYQQVSAGRPVSGRDERNKKVFALPGTPAPNGVTVDEPIRRGRRAKVAGVLAEAAAARRDDEVVVVPVEGERVLDAHEPGVEVTPDDMELHCTGCTWSGHGRDTRRDPGFCPVCGDFWTLTEGPRPEQVPLPMPEPCDGWTLARVDAELAQLEASVERLVERRAELDQERDQVVDQLRRTDTRIARLGRLRLALAELEQERAA